MTKREDLEKFKAEIQAHFPLRNLIYQPILHPAFKDWKTSRPSEATLNLILKSCGDIKGRKILDIGCCIGYYSHMMAKMGANVTGIEIKSKRYEFCRYLSKLYGLGEDNPQFINVDVANFAKSNKGKYDLILLLSTVHWLFKQRGEEAWTIMRKISEWTGNMYLTYDKGFAHGFSPEKCLDKTLFKRVENLGFPKSRARGQQRSIYLFRKN
ncbi:hypothetical protein ES702_03321 [subsurface metagenome]